MSASMNERASNARSPVYDRALLLHGSKRNEVLTLEETEQYGRDSFGDADYVSIYGMRPREWFSRRERRLRRNKEYDSSSSQLIEGLSGEAYGT